MNRIKVTNYIKWLIKYCDQITDKLLQEKRVILVKSEIPHYKIKLADEDSYDNLGYHNIRSHSKTNRQVLTSEAPRRTLTRILNEEVSKHETSEKFWNQTKLEDDIIESFFRFFSKSYVIQSHLYQEKFNIYLVNYLHEVIKVKSIIISEMHMVAGLTVSKTGCKFHYGGVDFIISRPTPIETLKHEQEDLLQKKTFNCWLELRSLSGQFNLGPHRKVIFLLLSLYNLGSIFSLGAMRNSYFGRRLSSKHKTFPRRDYFRYNLTKGDGKAIEKYFKQFHESLVKIQNLNPEKSKSGFNSSIKVAIDRYEELMFVFQNDSPKRVAYAIMGLEAIYSTDSGELKFKLTMRVTKIFKLLNLNPKMIAKNVKDAYNLRSKYAHGSIIKTKISFEFEETIIDYLRISIILALATNFSKNDFVTLLDESNYDDDATNKLKKEIFRIKKLIPIRLSEVTLKDQ